MAIFTKEIEFEIRAKYEYGENLKDLAILYKIPLATIKSRKQVSTKNGDPWIKGFRKRISYEDFISETEEHKTMLLKVHNQEATEELDHISGLMKIQREEELKKYSRSQNIGMTNDEYMTLVDFYTDKGMSLDTATCNANSVLEQRIEEAITRNKNKLPPLIVSKLDSVDKLLDLRNKVSNIYVGKDKADIERIKTETEHKKVELKGKIIDYKLKKKTSLLYLDEE